MLSSYWGVLTILSFIAEFFFAAVAFVYVRRLMRRRPTELTEEVGSVSRVLRMVRKREPMTDDELAYAKQVISDRRSLMAFSIPGAIFAVGCIYVFGSLEQLNGREPSIRAFIGVIPMLAATNLTLQLLRIGALKRRLPRPA